MEKIDTEDYLVDPNNRATYIGGSDMADVLGVDWGCQLHGVLKKRGVVADFPFHGNKATERGIMLEPIAAELYANRTGRQIRKAPWRSNPDFPYLGAHADYQIINNEKGSAPLSIKVISKNSYYKLRNATTADIPIGYMAQAMWEMFIWNQNWASFAFLSPDPWDLLTFDFNRDEEVIKGLLEAAQDFWRVVDYGPLPDKLPPEDRRCSNCEFRVRCHSQNLLALLNAEGGDDKPVYDAGVLPLADALSEARAVQDEAEQLVEEAKQRLAEYLNDREVIEAPGKRVYNRLQAGRRTFQHQAYAKKYPEASENMKPFYNQGAPFRVLRIYDVPKKIGE